MEPGDYTVVAVAFKEPGSPISMGEPDYMGAAKVTVVHQRRAWAGEDRTPSVGKRDQPARRPARPPAWKPRD